MGGFDIWESYRKTRDPSLKEQLVLKHLGLVKYLAGRLAVSASPAMTQEDLEGYGVIGLLDAIEKYNRNLGTEFKNYAYTRIRGAMLDEIRKQSWVPRSKWQKFHQLSNTKEKLRQKGLKADEQALAAEMGMDSARLRRLASEYYNAFPVSLDEAAGFENDGALGELISDPNSPDPLEVVTEKNEKEILAEAIRDLPDRDRLVLALYYQEELTLKEIGSILELTESRVCQLHARALQRLREKLYHRGTTYSARKKGVRI
jgi:RNA polymerase sigma factor for flagellar operon FliA